MNAFAWTVFFEVFFGGVLIGVLIGRISMSWQIGRHFILTPKHSFKGGSWKPGH
jgi:hypothetical protein